jgi:MoxR-like ATPase
MDDLKQINGLVQKEISSINKIRAEVGKIIVGQKKIIDRLLIGLMTGGHLLIEGVPGLAKTMAIKTLSQAMNVSYKRIQFTPDLLPADLIGTLIYDQSSQSFTPKLGPIFANFVLADEINRAPAKVQSALLEAMQEKQVTIGDTSYPLEAPFLVLATQNPLEQEGTYPLPEAQIDRFLLKVLITYPERDEERLIINRMTESELPSVNPVLKAEDIRRIQDITRQIYTSDKIKEYVLDIIQASRNPGVWKLDELQHMISYGASPRASLALIESAKAHAFLSERGYVTPEDIKAIAKDVLRHRIVLSFEAQAEELSTDQVVERILTEIEVP